MVYGNYQNEAPEVKSEVLQPLKLGTIKASAVAQRGRCAASVSLSSYFLKGLRSPIANVIRRGEEAVVKGIYPGRSG